MALKYSTALRNAQLDAISTAVGTSGILRIYSGTRPANVAAAITGTVLAEFVCNASAFAATASGGVLTANAIANDASANATGTATHYRLFQSNGTTAVIDGDVSTSGADLNLDVASIVTGQVPSAPFSTPIRSRQAQPRQPQPSRQAPSRQPRSRQVPPRLRHPSQVARSSPRHVPQPFTHRGFHENRSWPFR